MSNTFLNLPYHDLLAEAVYLADRYPIDSPQQAIDRLLELLASNNYCASPSSVDTAAKGARATRYPTGLHD